MPWKLTSRGEGQPPTAENVSPDYEPREGEVVVDEMPSENEVWDSEIGGIRSKTAQELFEEARTQKIDAFAHRAVDDLRPYVTGEHGDREMLFIVAKHVKALYDAQGIPADPRLEALISTGEKAMTKLEEIEAVGSVEELEGIEW